MYVILHILLQLLSLNVILVLVLTKKNPQGWRKEKNSKVPIKDQGEY